MYNISSHAPVAAQRLLYVMARSRDYVRLHTGQLVSYAFSALRGLTSPAHRWSIRANLRLLMGHLSRALTAFRGLMTPAAQAAHSREFTPAHGRLSRALTAFRGHKAQTAFYMHRPAGLPRPTDTSRSNTAPATSRSFLHRETLPS